MNPLIRRTLYALLFVAYAPVLVLAFELGRWWSSR